MRVCNIFFPKKLTQTKKFPLANLFARIYVFSLQTIKYRALCFSTKKGAVRVVFKCKLYLKNSIELTKKNFAFARAKIFFVSRISGNNSIIFFGLITRRIQLFWFSRTIIIYVSWILSFQTIFRLLAMTL